MIQALALQKHLDKLLDVNSFVDYCPNGLQVEGTNEINRVVCGVSASQALIDAAIQKRADAIIVHHGYFWKGEAPTITGMKKDRIKALLNNNINLFAYHLPLDAHKDLGNNAQIAKELGFKQTKQSTEEPLLWYSELEDATTIKQLEALINNAYPSRKCQLLNSPKNHLIKKVAWCSGSAQQLINEAFDLGADAFISGEVSEQTYHVTQERPIHYFCIGHHISEMGGVKAISSYLNSKLNLDSEFIDCFNPI